MSEAVAKRYAEALFEVAKERHLIDEFESQLNVVNETLKSSNDLQKVLSHSQVESNNKKDIIEKVFSQDLSQEVINLLKVLVDRRREKTIHYLINDYVDMANDYRGIEDMVVTTAQPLTEDEKQKLAEDLGQKLDKKLRLNAKVDQNIIGGIIVKIGNTVFDSSLSGKLKRLKTQLKS
ncbi:F0F1 ATP synthase subunit delta [Tuberibacillus sp. Marseille-P3662]|uniref:F0F1 ATP synthase subunit delta n=1 Tax=Tuberibacillus sp. Marseille-P3662 TaxID=1965358 RepID=UPI000A1C9CED|nr:F0F1 ATP synthase subunit delta [Tuberibacillus sp. Marseille-P3662]